MGWKGAPGGYRLQSAGGQMGRDAKEYKIPGISFSIAEFLRRKKNSRSDLQE